MYIPRTLQELSLEEIDKLKREGNTLYTKLTGVDETLQSELDTQLPTETSPRAAPESPDGEEKSEGSSSDEESESDEGKQ